MLVRDTAAGLGTPARHFGENVMKFLLVAQVVTAAELARVARCISSPQEARTKYDAAAPCPFYRYGIGSFKLGIVPRV
jgi:hypothetical protein